MSKSVNVLLVGTALWSSLIAGSTSRAAEITVTVNSGSFSPSTRTINEGDQITWVWGGSGSHTTTHVPSGGGVLWNQPISSSNEEFTRTFNTPGTFNYKCTPHGFTGTITVTPSSGILDEPGTDASDALSDALPAALNQNSPNPFNAATQLEYSLDRDGSVDLSVYNILGQHVATLIEGFQTGGVHTAHWDGRDENGNDIPSGIYFARMVRPVRS